MPKSRLSAFLYLLLVFASGSVVGALGHRLYMVNTVLSNSAPPPHNPEDVRKRLVAEMRDKVKLDDAQIAQYNQILDKTRTDFHALHDRMNAEGQVIHQRQVTEVKAILRPDQVALYDKVLAEHEAAKQRRLQQTPPPPAGTK